MNNKQYTPYDKFPVDEVRFTMGQDRTNKTTINMSVGAMSAQVCIVTPAAVTNWPRVTGDGNFGTMWGPTDIQKAKYSLDLTDGLIDGAHPVYFTEFSELLERVDDQLLHFVYENQLRILGRKNLSKDEVKMLQIRSVRPKYDKISGVLTGHSVQLSTAKFGWDGLGGRQERKINVCDLNCKVIQEGLVCPGDVVAATMYANQVYTGVGGDKFGIHWGFEDVQVIAQRAKLEYKTEVPAFSMAQYPFAAPYDTPKSITTGETAPDSMQFSD